MITNGHVIVICVFILAITIMVVVAITKDDSVPKTTLTSYEGIKYQPYTYSIQSIEPIENSCFELQEYATNEHSYYTADGKEMLSTWKQKGDHVYDVHVFEKVTECNWKQLS